MEMIAPVPAKGGKTIDLRIDLDTFCTRFRQEGVHAKSILYSTPKCLVSHTEEHMDEQKA